MNLLKDKNFRLLFIGETVSNLGDQFTFIALPWLIVKLTSDSLVLGTVLALAGIPRALFMLFGGALVDRFLPRKVMIVSNIVRLVGVSLLSLMILIGKIDLWMIYVYSLVFGTADAFFIPAQTSMVTRLSPKEFLEKANTLVMGATQLSQFVGPILVGLIIGLLDKGNHDFRGIGLAMAFDAFTFVISLVTLWNITKKEETVIAKDDDVLKSIKQGLKFAWKNRGLRYILILAAAINFLLVGPLFVAIPIIAKNILDNGATGYGIVMSAYGVGTLVGYVLAGILPRLKDKKLVVWLLSVMGTVGIMLSVMALAKNTFQFSVLGFFMALISGYVSITFITLIQKKTSEEMMGRIMSIVTFCAIGMIPLSEIFAGFLVKISVNGLFLVSGILFSVLSWAIILVKDVRDFAVEG